MNIFVLCSGRCGSLSLAKACSHATNFTAGHETRHGLFCKPRLEYQENHIEVDNRLAFYLGRLWETYGTDAMYVHLERDRKDTIKSFYNRAETGIIAAWKWAVGRNDIEDNYMSWCACVDYVDTMNENIRMFLEKPVKSMTIHTDKFEEGLREMWQWAGIEGDLDAACRELTKRHNAS